jgi:hypothetical protein
MVEVEQDVPFGSFEPEGKLGALISGEAPLTGQFSPFPAGSRLSPGGQPGLSMKLTREPV